jgi:hypothetical protein
MYVKANIGENANAWLGIDNENTTGSTALRLILNGATTSGFQYVQSTNMTQVFANAGDIQLINGSSLGLTIANTTGNGTFSNNVYALGLGIGTTTLTSGWQSDTRGNVLISGSDSVSGRLNVYYGALGSSASQRFDVGSSTIDTYNLYVKTLSGGAFTGTVTAYITNAGAASFNSTLNVGTTAYVTNDIFIGDTTSGSGRFFITDSSNQGITLRRTGATGDRFKLFVGNGTTYTQDNCIILGTNTDIDFYTGSSPVKRLTIANSGDVGIGTTSTPTERLDINHSSSTACFIRLQSTAGSGVYVGNRDNNLELWAGAAKKTTISSAGVKIFGNAESLILQATTVNSEIYLGLYNSAGSRRCYIGYGSTPTAILDIWNTENGAIQFGTNNSLKMSILSGGNVLIGTTSNDARLCVRGVDSGTNNAVYVDNSSAAGLFLIRNDGLFFVGTSASSPYNNAQTGRTAILSSGGILGYLVSTRESKANIKSISNIDFINQLNPVQFNYRKKNDETNTFTDEVETNLTYGFIADEVENVNKELVFYNDDNTLAGVNYNSMIAILTKTVQQLNDRIIKLENK